jgi:hypothetical protein
MWRELAIMWRQCWLEITSVLAQTYQPTVVLAQNYEPVTSKVLIKKMPSQRNTKYMLGSEGENKKISLHP